LLKNIEPTVLAISSLYGLYEFYLL